MTGHRLATAQKRKGLTQREAAEFFDVSERAYKNYELNKRSIPHELLASACKAFEVDANWLLRGRGQIELSELDRLYPTAILAAEDRYMELESPPSTQERLDTVIRLVEMFRRRGQERVEFQLTPRTLRQRVS